MEEGGGRWRKVGEGWRRLEKVRESSRNKSAVNSQLVRVHRFELVGVVDEARAMPAAHFWDHGLHEPRKGFTFVKRSNSQPIPPLKGLIGGPRGDFLTNFLGRSFIRNYPLERSD